MLDSAIGKFFSKYSQSFALLGWGAALVMTIFFGQRLLGDKGEVAALAGFITIFGVSANNLVQAIGRREREKEKREFEVRRDIYLEFADSIAKKWAGLAKLLHLDMAEKDLRGGNDLFASAGNKVRLVGSQRTVEHLEKLVATFVKFELSLRQERNTLNDHLAEIRQIDKQFKENQETMTQVNSYLQNMKPSGILNGWTDKDNTQIQNLRQQFSNLSIHNTELAKKSATLAQELVISEKGFRIHYIEGITIVRPLITEIMISMRAELDVSVNEEWFRKLAQATDAELSIEFKRAIENARQK